MKLDTMRIVEAQFHRHEDRIQDMKENLKFKMISLQQEIERENIMPEVIAAEATYIAKAAQDLQKSMELLFEQKRLINFIRGDK